VHVHRNAVLEREAPVARDVVGVRVRLERGDEADAVPPGRFAYAGSTTTATPARSSPTR
jgi:hypothetical protein